MNLRWNANQGARATGFTLLELLAVLAILAILAQAVFPLAEMAARRSREEELRVNLRQIRDAIDRYHRLVQEGRIKSEVGASGYPKTLDALVDGVTDLSRPDGGKIYLLRRIPSDPLAADGGAGAKSWGLRSYVSPPQDPKAGDDVFDVYSLSSGVGINGIPYQKW